MALTNSRVFIFWSLLIFPHCRGESFDLVITPTDIVPGLTNQLTVNCTFTYAADSNFSSIVSLLVSKADLSDGNNKFVELVSLNAFAGDHVIDLSPVNATASGHLETANGAYLSLQWSQPSSAESGQYRCEANGMDDTGHPLSISTTESVTSQPTSLDELLNKISDLQSQLDQVKELLNNQSQPNQACSQQQFTILRGILSDKFQVSDLFNNHFYMLSITLWQDAGVAESDCERYGGYLTEVEDDTEWMFIKSFVNPFSDIDIVLLGGTDEAQEGVWTYRYSGRPVTFNGWYIMEPGVTASHNCMGMYRGYGWAWNDERCTQSGNSQYYLCEVPMF